MGAGKDYDAIVVGAGYAGVTAARDMRDRGLRVVLLEARDRVGGRTYSKRFKGRDELMEFGGAWFSCDYMPNMAREVERYDAPLMQSPDLETYRFITEGRLREFPVPAADLVAFERAWLAIANAAARISTHTPLHMQELADLDVSWRTFLAALELPSATEEFFLTALSTYVGGHPHDFSALQSLGCIATLGKSPYNAFHGVLVDKFANGTADILHRMIESSGVDLHLRTPVTAISHDSEGVEVSVDGGGPQTAFACVLAVPANVIRTIRVRPELSEPKREATARNHPGRGYRVNMLIEGAPPHFFGLGWGPALQMLITEYQLDENHSLVSGFGAEGLHSLDPNDRDQVQAAVKQFIPDAEVVEVDAHDFNSDPYSDGTWRINPPGEARTFARIMNEPEGRLYFAGSDVSLGLLNGWMEGAVQSGHRAAERICAALGRR